MSEKWRQVRLGDMATWRGGMTPSLGTAAYWDGGTVPWVSSKEVTGGVLKDTSRKVTQEAVEATSLQLVPAGSVVVVVRSGILLHTLPVAFVPFATTVNQDIKIGQPSKGVDGRFLAYLLESRASDILSSLRKTGTTVQSINFPALLDLPLPLPPLPTQWRILDLMEHLDDQLNRVVVERECAIELRSSLRRELRSATTVPLRTLADEDGIQIGPFGSQLHAHEYTPDGTPVVMPQDIVDGTITKDKIKRVPESVAQRLNRHRLEPGDIVFPRRGDLSKRSLVTAEQRGWVCGTGCIRFRAADSSVAGLLYEGLADQAVTDWLIEHAVGTTMLNLNTAIVGDLPVPDMSEAALVFAETAAEATAAIDALTQEAESVRRLRGCALSALISGSPSIPETYDVLLGVAS